MADFNHDTADDAFHEIQLSGKQLVALFMVTTVISVIIFLCGVLVGRGVRAEEIGAEGLAASSTAAPVPAAEPPADLPTPSTESAPPVEPKLDYTRRLESPKPVSETPVQRADEPAPAPAASEAPKAPATRAAEPPVASPSAQGALPGTWIVQVISLRDRSAATQVVQRLTKKGYPAFLVAPAPGAPTQLYKVQVGKYADRSEAQQVQARLKREEQFDPWIVR